MVVQHEHPFFGPLRNVAQPLRFDGERPSLRRPVPMHSEHGREILREAGFDVGQIDALAKEAAVELHE